MDFDDFGIVLKKTFLFIDSQSALAMGKDDTLHRKIKHVATKVTYVKEAEVKKWVNVVKFPGEEKVADITIYLKNT